MRGVKLSARGQTPDIDAVKTGGWMNKGGVQKGDVLLAIDDEPVGTPQQAQALLRRAVAEFLPFLARVRRGDQELELVVPLTPKKQ